MNKRIKKYLKAIEVTNPIQQRIEEFHGLCETILEGKEICDLFVDEYINNDGERTYTAITFFTENMCLSAESFLSETNIHITPLDLLDSFACKLMDFDFKKATKNSRVTIDLFHKNQARGYFKASQENCMYLVKIMKKYLIPYTK